MNKVEYKGVIDIYTDCVIVLENYTNNDNTAISIWQEDEGFITTLTTNLLPLPQDEACIDTNNNPHAIEFLEKYGFANVVEGQFESSNYWKYPKVQLNMEKLLEYNVNPEFVPKEDKLIEKMIEQEEKSYLGIDDFEL